MGIDPVSLAVITGANMLASHVQGNIQRDAAKRAGQSEEASIEEAANMLKESTAKAESYYDPYRKSGEESLNMYMEQLKKGPGDVNIETSPEYLWKKEQLTKGINEQLAAAGKARSGVGLTAYHIPALTKLAQDEAASQEEEQYRNYLNTLNSYMPLMQYGYNTSGNLANLASNYGANISNLFTKKGQSQAATAQNIANADIYSFAQPLKSIGSGIEQYSKLKGLGAF